MEKLQSEGKIEEAINQSIRANGLAAEWLGPDHRAVAGGKSSLALMHLRLGEFDEAVAVLQDLILTLRESSEPVGPLIQAALSKIQYVHRAKLLSADRHVENYSSLWTAAADLHHVIEPGHARELGNALRDRYGRTNDLRDLELAIRAANRALDLTVSDPVRHSQDINNLGGRLLDRFQRISDLSDLDRAIELLDRGLLSVPFANLRGIMLHNLSTALAYRFERKLIKSDLHRAIKIAQETVTIDQRALSHLLHLLVQLLDRQKNGFASEDLRLAFEVIRDNEFEAVLAVNLLYTLSFLWLSVTTGTKSFNRADLETALEAALLAVKKSETLGLPTSASKSLVALLLLRRQGPEDRRSAIDLCSKAMTEGVGEGSWDDSISGVWHELGQRLYSLSGRGAQSLDILSVAIDLLTRSKELSKGQRKANVLGDLSLALRTRFTLSNNFEHIKLSVNSAEEAFQLTSQSGVATTEIRNALGSALWYRYNESRNRADLDRGLEVSQLENEMARDHSDPILLNGRAIWLSERFFARGDLSDLDEAIRLWLEAVQLNSLEAEQKVRYRRNVVVSLISRFRRSGENADLKRAFDLIKEVEQESWLNSTGRADLLHLRSQIFWTATNHLST